MNLSNRVALVTGGAQGLGKSIALALAKQGADVVICDYLASDGHYLVGQAISPNGGMVI